jgi:hypothetical protein
MNFQQFIFSESPRLRVLRHLACWGVFLAYFYIQSISPKNYNDLYESRTYHNALMSLFCFAPLCVMVVYFFTNYLLPLIIAKRYFLFLAIFISVYLVGTTINYFTASVFYSNVVYSIPPLNDFRRRVELGSWNTRWAMILGIIAIGIQLARSWCIQTRTNLAMLKMNAKTEMRIQKSRIHPEWLFRALDKIKASLQSQSPTSTTMILNLSDLLSYSLYESDEDVVPLEKELLELEHLVSLERCDSNTGFTVTIRTSGDFSNKDIAPMSVINKVVQYITTVPNAGRQPCSLDLHFRARRNTLVLYTTMTCVEDEELTTIQWPVIKGEN